MPRTSTSNLSSFVNAITFITQAKRCPASHSIQRKCPSSSIPSSISQTPRSHLPRRSRRCKTRRCLCHHHQYRYTDSHPPHLPKGGILTAAKFFIFCTIPPLKPPFKLSTVCILSEFPLPLNLTHTYLIFLQHIRPIRTATKLIIKLSSVICAIATVAAPQSPRSPEAQSSGSAPSLFCTKFSRLACVAE
jgi:hypothetical protein